MLFRAREQELDYNLKNNIYKSHANLLVHAQNILHESWPLCKGKLQHGTLKMWPLAALQR